MKITKLSVRVAVFAALSLAACGKATVEQGSKVDLSYEIKDPTTQEFIASGTKNIEFDYTGTDLFQLIQGSKKGESKSDLLIDPFNEHNPDLVYRQTALVLNEMGIPVKEGSTVQLKEENAVITSVLSSDGVEQVELDANPVETIFPYLWTFEVIAIK